ncbi:MAG TPA: protein phosphatase 2C domain-containing protein [Armatimonadota bacterium]|nr:protein phosphatase 2C domain-containing protein [Armatimonadota bacterium]
MVGFYKVSLIGGSHLAGVGGVCQDACNVKTLANGWVVAVIADGLGSAKHSDVGARCAVEEVIRFVENNVPERWHPESLMAVLRVSYHAALKRIKIVAAEQDNPAHEYDTTLTSVIYNGVGAVVGHVGDGGIVTLSAYGDFTIATKAQKGEEFNEVVPLKAGPDYWSFAELPGPICALLMMTDGVYDVACPWLIAKSSQPVYVNYVRPFMDINILAVKTADDFENVQVEIEEFLTSDMSRQITDDKTVVCLINTDTIPETKPVEYYVEPDWATMAKQHREKLYGHATTGADVNAQAQASEPTEPERAGAPDMATPPFPMVDGNGQASFCESVQTNRCEMKWSPAQAINAYQGATKARVTRDGRRSVRRSRKKKQSFFSSLFQKK